MAKPINLLAWLAVVVTVLSWAILPRIASAYPVLLPPLPVIETTILPPVTPTDRREADR